MLAKPELILSLWFVPMGLFIFLPLCFGILRFATSCFSAKETTRCDVSTAVQEKEGILLPEGVLVDRRKATRKDRRVNKMVVMQNSYSAEMAEGDVCSA